MLMDSLNISSSLLAGAFGLLLFTCYLLKKISFANNGKVAPLAPQLPGAWPVIGHFRLMTGSKLPHLTLGNMADKLGPIFTLRLGSKPALVVSSWEVAKEIFTDYDVAVTARPPLAAAKHLAYDYAMFPFHPNGSYWRDARKLATSKLLSNHRLEQLKHVRIQEVETCIKELYYTWAEKKKNSGDVLVEMKEWFGDLNLNVILKMIVGKKLFGPGGAVGEDEKDARRCQKLIREHFHYLGMLVLRDAVPFLGWLDLGGHERSMKRTADELEEFVVQWLEEHKQNRASSGIAVEDRDFMDAVISALDGNGLSGFDGDTIIKSTSLSMITGAGDTITVAMVWAIALLLNNRHALKKVQEELDHHVGKGRIVNETDISKLVYLQATVKETLRLYPPATIPAPRLFTKDCTVGGYHIPKDTWLIVNVWKIQTDPRVWPDPFEFKPERFLTTHRNVDVRGQNHELLPFGSGRRSCPAMSFGLQMLHLALASFLHAFDISSPGHAPVDMAQSAGLTNIKATPLEVVISPRLSPKCFQ